MLGPASKILDPGSCTVDPESLDPGSRTRILNARTLDPGSRLPDTGVHDRVDDGFDASRMTTWIKGV